MLKLYGGRPFLELVGTTKTRKKPVLSRDGVLFYSLSRKTVNARENFWNVYCFATNQMRDETAKDNRQTAEWINHDLTRNRELAFSSTRNL